MDISYTPYLFAYYPHKNQVIKYSGSYEIEGLRSYVKKVIKDKLDS